MASSNFDCPDTDSNNPSAPSRQPSIHRNFDPYNLDLHSTTTNPRHNPRRRERTRVTSRTSDVESLRQGVERIRQRVASADRMSRRSLTPEGVSHTVSRAPHSQATNINSSHLHRHRLRRQREDDTLGTVQDAVDRLNEATNDLSSILNEPLPHNIASDEYMASLLADSTYTSERQHKRRKVEPGLLASEPAPQYGHYGQVVPGRLRMTMMTCDGGSLLDRDFERNRRSYSPDNVLINDKSVYCTERDSCNIVLRHFSHTPISVSKIIIKAPDIGFTAPVQEGLIFISMHSHDLIPGTERYRIRSSPPPRQPAASVYPESQGQHAARPRYGLTRATWTNRLNSVNVNERLPSRRQDMPPISSIIPFDSRQLRDDEGGSQLQNSSHPYTSGTSSAPTNTVPVDLSLPRGYNVETSCDPPSGDEEDVSSDAVMYDRQRRRNVGWDSLTSDEEWETSARRQRRPTPRSVPRKIELDAGPGFQGDNVDPTLDILAPHAHFFIEPKKYVVSIKFNPPISGRYILLKLFSPQNHDNIDIQNVSVYGFAGFRYVPAIKMR